MRKTVTLFIPPYLFRRKKKALNIGKKATFECVSCAKNDIALSNLQVESPPITTFGNSISMIPPSMENQVIII